MWGKIREDWPNGFHLDSETKYTVFGSKWVVREEVENPQDVEKYEFKVAQVTMAFGVFFCLFLFLTLWQHSIIWQWIGKSKQKASLKMKKSLDVSGRRNWRSQKGQSKKWQERYPEAWKGTMNSKVWRAKRTKVTGQVKS